MLPIRQDAAAGIHDDAKAGCLTLSEYTAKLSIARQIDENKESKSDCPKHSQTVFFKILTYFEDLFRSFYDFFSIFPKNFWKTMR
jgi:hypothetical protein